MTPSALSRIQQWSAPLDIGNPRALSASSPGMVVVAGTEGVAAYSERGELQWQSKRQYTDVRTLPDGRTLLRAGAAVQLVDMLGELLVAWDFPGPWAPIPFADDRFVDLSDAGTLVCTAFNGTVEWEVELECRTLYPPTIADRQIVVSDAVGLRIFNEHGVQQSRVEICASSSDRAPLAAAQGPITAFADGYVVPFRNAIPGAGWYRWRPDRGQAEPFAAGAALNGPSCVSKHPSGDLFVSAGAATSAELQPLVRAYSAADERIWQLEHPRITAAIGTTNGDVVLLCTPTLERWEKYREFQRVEDECRVTVVNRTGTVIAEYMAQAPIAPQVGVGQDRVYIVIQGSLLALAI